MGITLGEGLESPPSSGVSGVGVPTIRVGVLVAAVPTEEGSTKQKTIIMSIYTYV